MQAFETLANSGVNTNLAGQFLQDPFFAVHGDQSDNEYLASSLDSLTVTEGNFEKIDLRVHDIDDLVAQGKALFEEDIARFDCPDLDDRRMLWGSAEYFRWYSADGKKREAPLDYDELLELVMFRDRCSAEDAEREVSLNSRARVGDKAKWNLVIQLGYLDWTREFAKGVYGVD